MSRRLTRLVARVSRVPTQAQVRYVTPVPFAHADGLVARVYGQLEHEFGILAPPVMLHSPAPAPLAAVWLMLRESLVASGRVPRPVKEAVAVAVSRANTCPYCAEVHGVALTGLAGSRAAALASGEADRATDPVLREVSRWAQAGVARHLAGPPPLPDPVGAVPELIGTAVTFDYLNRMVNVFLPDSPVPARIPTAAQRGIRALAAVLLRPALRRVPAPGTARDLLPAAPLPADLTWAAGNPAVGEAFSRAAAVLTAAGERAVPAPVRDLVTGRLAGAEGQLALPSRAWVDEAVADLAVADRPLAAVALVAACASYQSGPELMARFRTRHADDRTLIEVCSWASFAAARRLGDWLWRSALASTPTLEGSTRREGHPGRGRGSAA